MQYTLRQLAYLVAVADHGNVTAAAQALHTSQPGVSSAIAHLENVFGLTLFVRHHAKGVTLTPGGQGLVAAARQLLGHADDLMAQAQDMGQSVRGRLTLGCFTTLAPILLPRLFSALRQSHPELEIDLLEGDTAQLQEALLAGRIELALMYDLDLTDSLHRQPLSGARPYALVAEGHRLARRRKVQLAELVNEPLVLLDHPHSREYFLSLFRQRGLEPLVRHRTVNFELVRGLVAKGFGYALLNLRPNRNVTYDGGKLVYLDIADDLPELPIVLAWPASIALTRKATLVRDLCARVVGVGPAPQQQLPR